MKFSFLAVSLALYASAVFGMILPEGSLTSSANALERLSVGVSSSVRELGIASHGPEALPLVGHSGASISAHSSHHVGVPKEIDPIEKSAASASAHSLAELNIKGSRAEFKKITDECGVEIDRILEKFKFVKGYADLEVPVQQMWEQLVKVGKSDFDVNEARAGKQALLDFERSVDGWIKKKHVRWLKSKFRRKKPAFSLDDLIDKVTRPALTKLDEEKFARLNSALAQMEESLKLVVKSLKMKADIDRAMSKVSASDKHPVYELLNERALENMEKLKSSPDLALIKATRRSYKALEAATAMSTAEKDALYLRLIPEKFVG